MLLPAWFLAPVLGGRAIGQGIGFEIAADRWFNEPFDVLHADADLQVRPWRQVVLESWSAGQPAFWNPHQLLGVPLMANWACRSWPTRSPPYSIRRTWC